MMRSLFSGVSGLKTHQTRMDVIGHNIANVNTVAYKYSSMTFSSLMSQTTQKASGANATTGKGGVNARQIGLGVKTAAININISGQGASQSTGNPFDIMINGENFFVVSDGTKNYFTRDGSFYVDGAGNLAMTSIGFNVMGWQVDPDTGDIKKDTVSALRIMSSANKTFPPEATSHGYMSGIIDKHDTDVTSEAGRVVNLNFYDTQGYSYTAKFVIRQSASDKSNYSMELMKILDPDNKEVPLPEDPAQRAALFGSANNFIDAPTTLSLVNGYSWKVTKDQTTGAITSVDGIQKMVNGTPTDIDMTKIEEVAAAFGYVGEEQVKEFGNLALGDSTTPKPIKDNLGSFLTDMLGTPAAGTTPAVPGSAIIKDNEITGVTMTGRMFDGVTINFDGKSGDFVGLNGGTGDNAANAILNLTGLSKDGNFPSVEIDFSGLSSVDNKGTSTVAANKGSDDPYDTGSGRRKGDMIGVAIQEDGRIYASYDNGMTKLLGQIATALFANPSGLEKNADNLYSATLNSGEFDGIGVDISASGNSMSTGQLEMSNVDLSAEFTEMITTQRGFQANSRIITVSDTLLEELTNLKR
ncbi:MAG: flagellar hook-basal body complex protein [Lachnospiraceae bacterium]|nr:flagellar hook-basal body complex protein [Lachnospiraceae bacterium]